MTHTADWRSVARRTAWRVEQLFKPLQRPDLHVGLLAALIAEAVYWCTAAPSITFLDSGELVTAAAGFGVPHPTGYPLWTFLAWLFTLLPLGHTAWEVNLFSGICAACATGLLAGMLSHNGRRLGLAVRSSQFLSVTLSLCFALTTSVWSQAVFAEVYTLHVLVVAVLILVLYRWLLDPSWRAAFLVAVFVLSVGMTNHHLVLALAPLPLLTALWIRPRLAAELAAYSVGAGAIAYIAFGSLSAEASIQETAMRSGQLAIALLLSLVLLRHRLQAWRTGLAMLPVVAIGLAPYLYLPFASSTNPPMNWGYTQTTDGFFYSVNRTPYQRPFSSQLQDSVGRLVGTGEAEAPQGRREWEASETFPKYLRNYRDSLHASFTPAVWLLLLGGLAAVSRRRREVGPWYTVLLAGFLLSAILQAATSATVDAGGLSWLDWRLQMPYLGYSYLFVTLILGVGAAQLWLTLERFRQSSRIPLAAGCAALPFLAFFENVEECSQRGHDYARRFGHEMLADLPEGSVLFGGTDAGRFVPTWMILGESLEKPRHRYARDFDRRDLYIITQPQLPARFYHYYIRDHYGTDRPEPTRLGRWLRRDEQYPEVPLRLPNDDDLRQIVNEATAAGDLRALGQVTARWIFEANKEKHPFFIEESRIMRWAIPHAVPEGPRIRLAPEPVMSYDAETIERDRSYWERTLDELLSDENFIADREARIPFSSLRRLGGDLYRSRGLFNEAEAAFRQALALQPGEMASSAALADLLYDRGRFDEASELLEELTTHPVIIELGEAFQKVARTRRQRASQHAQLLLRPVNSEPLQMLLETYDEATGGALLNLVEDLRPGRVGLINPVVLRRVLANYRTLGEETVAAVVGRRALADRGAHHHAVIRLLVAFQRIRANWDDESEGLRAELIQELVRVGEGSTARDLLDLGRRWGTQRTVVSDRLGDLTGSQDNLLAQFRELKEQSARDRDPSALLQAVRSHCEQMPAEDVQRAERALRSYDPDSPSPSDLSQLVIALREVALPELARAVLLSVVETENLSESITETAIRLSSTDLRPDLLTDLADLQAGVGITRPTSLTARASFQFGLNDQQGLIQTLAILSQRVDRNTLLTLLASDPQLELLARDYRFREFMIRNLYSNGAA